MDFEKFEASDQIRDYLKYFKANDYSLAVASFRQWGKDSAGTEAPEGEKYYQIIPDSKDGGVFKWYVKSRPY